MSAAAVKWAKSQDIPQTEKAVLLAIADAHSIRWGFSAPSQQTMARDIGVTRETVNRAIVRLEARGLIIKATIPRKKGQWDRRVYSINHKFEAKSRPNFRASRVTQDHTAPCDFHQTRHRVTQDHTSRRDNVVALRMVASGGAK